MDKQTNQDIDIDDQDDDMIEEIELKADEMNHEEVIEADFSGRKYIGAIGRRKTASAQVRVYQKGKGAFVVNSVQYKEYFPQNLISILFQPFKSIGMLKDFDVSIKVVGGGKKGQAQATRHGITRALVKIDEELKSRLRSKGWVTRDPRVKERKKPGLLKARRAPQWSKR